MTATIVTTTVIPCARRASALLLIAALALAVVACGRKGDPQPLSTVQPETGAAPSADTMDPATDRDRQPTAN